jgi:hypothetical protein
MLLPIVGIILSAGLTYSAQFLRQRIKSEVANRAISSVENIVQAAVLEAQQTVVDNLNVNGHLRIPIFGHEISSR